MHRAFLFANFQLIPSGNLFQLLICQFFNLLIFIILFHSCIF